MEITELQREDEAAWDAYVYNSPTSTFYHQIGRLNVVETTYKHKPVYLVAKEEGEIKGVLPLFLMKSMIFGNKLLSVPFAHYGGVCAGNKIVEETLIEEAKRITEECLDDKIAIMRIMNKTIKYITPKYSIDYHKSILKNPRKHRDMPQKYIKNGTERGVNQNPHNYK